MLKLLNIKKNYYVGDITVKALRDINLSFRKNEFVSILGPSGSGKTTLLNIIGGLDKYTEGDLIINGRTTKDYQDRDWDVYRNHRIGFVFQSYNLIPHQSVLSNVELALTIAGINKEERTKRAKDALDKVGLSDQYYKKPNQLSGGQSQRVAIARALVNDPEILLADEPTGAIDSKTSKQILDLIKKVSEDRLVIMVTHNQELAEEYSTRIVTLLDGKLQSDSDPLELDEVVVKREKSRFKERRVKTKNNKERAKMSWWTTFKLSILNLLSKKSRTILTSIAGSIGIIGISLVLSLSYGLQSYIDIMQDDMLSGNPIIIQETTLDLEQIMQRPSLHEKIDIIKKEGYINVNNMIETVAKKAAEVDDMFIKNNITEDYLDYVTNIPIEDAAAVFLDYEIDITNNLYVDFYEDEDNFENISLSVLREIYTQILKENETTEPFANLIVNFTDIIAQAPNNSDYILSQYNILESIVEGEIATEKDEIMLVLDKDGMVSDLILAQLGFYNQEEFTNMVLKAIDDDRFDETIPIKNQFSYEELLGKEFVWYSNDTVFEATNDDNKPFEYHAYSKDFNNGEDGIPLKIVAILEPKENISYGSLKNGFYYTEALTKEILRENKKSKVVLKLFDEEKDGYATSAFGISPNSNLLKGITYEYTYNYFDEEIKKEAFVGKTNLMSSLMMMGMPGSLSKRDLGGEEIASKISIYPQNLHKKENVLKYLDKWNSDEELIIGNKTIEKADREEIIYTDPLSIIFNMIGETINMITIALIGFTTLALVVSSVMIAIITYVSVVERIKEIGVIRSLGGRKRDVANLFIAETFIIGLAAGIIAILFTYVASFIINLLVIKAIGAKIAVFPWHYALIMITISIILTLISGFVPSRSAARKDPVVALRTE